ncbi:MAG: spore protease YyaC [Clostridia bacterium]
MEISGYNQEAKNELAKVLPKEDVVYMCIGTDSVLADSLGPRVGSYLQENMNKPIFVYGIANNNITAINLLSAYRFIKLLHPDKKIVVVDSAVGDTEEIGKIIFNDAPLCPGAATNKNLPSLGDYSIMGVVAERGLKDFYKKSVDKQTLVDSLAQIISQAICQNCPSVEVTN